MSDRWYDMGSVMGIVMYMRGVWIEMSERWYRGVWEGDITMRYGCWVKVMMLGWVSTEGKCDGRRGCVLVVGDKIDETCVWARIENWKYM